ncbi:MAG: UvrD-helicase domain-containing protein [Clostridia bacterium]|nr:UvrD-helicase domain-containing protein [Clostridia bacterium]
MIHNQLESRYLAAKRALFDRCFESLNERQRDAVYTTEGSLLVLAGAGSGKTTVLVRRIVFLIRYGNAYFSEYVPYGITEERVRELERAADLPGEEIEAILPEFISSPCPPWQILAITFTNKAANEIKNRLRGALPEEGAADSVWAGTFHSICVRILRAYGDRLGYEKGFTIYDATDTKNAVTETIKSLNIDEKTLPVKSVIAEIGRAKDALLTPEEYEEEFGGKDYRLRQIARVYRGYQDRLKSSNAMDFDDLIMQTVRLLEEDGEVREYYQRKFRYVSVDEFQDTNLAQLRLTLLLSQGHGNIMVVGDDDQSIYKFRGAVIDNILHFDKKLKNTKTIRLEQNYRSTQVILDAANGVISHNVGRKGKTLWTSRGGGEPITLRVCNDQNEEARTLVSEIQGLVAKGSYRYRDCAILYRTNAQSNVIERTFAKSGVPYRMLGGLRFNDRKEIRDIVAYLQFIANPSDKERMRRIINEPNRKIGNATVEGVEIIALEQNCSVYTVMRHADSYPALSRSASKLKAFAAMIGELRELLETDISLEALVKQVLDRTGYRQMLIDGGEEEKERLENLEEFLSGVIEYEKNNEEPTLFGFLEENALVSEVDKYDEEADAVVMMTVHSAKGLEFPVVFLPGMEDGIFPGMQNILGSPDEMEEERRLAYVAITRAKDRLCFLRAKNRMLYGRTSYNPVSRFVEEIPAELLREEPTYGSAPSGYDRGPRTYFSASPSERTPLAKEDGGFTLMKKVVPNEKKTVTLREGDRVLHLTFGEGEILSVRPMGSDVLYEVMFDRVGTKKLMGNYARLKKLTPSDELPF